MNKYSVNRTLYCPHLHVEMMYYTSMKKDQSSSDMKSATDDIWPSNIVATSLNATVCFLSLWEAHFDAEEQTYPQVDLREVGLARLPVDLKVLIVSVKEAGGLQSL